MFRHRLNYTPISASRREEVVEQLSKASSPGFDFFLFVILSCIIATFGLLTDSVAVIIGAMLVAPLMSPIMAISLASVAGKESVFQKALLALIEGIILAVSLSFLVSWISQQLPFSMLESLPAEVTSRIRPTPFDLGIALAGGIAAAYALAQPHLSAALPGVAIATALMPPLCTVGIGISLHNQRIALGASLLFATNLAAILFAGILVFFALGFRPITRENGSWFKLPRSLVISAILVLMVTIPLIGLSLRFVNETRFQQSIRQAVDEVVVQDLPGAQLVSLDINGAGESLSLLVTLRSSRQPSYSQVLEWQKEIATMLQRELAFQLITVPVTRLDPLIPPTPTPTFTPGPSPSPTITPTRTATPTPAPTDTSTPTITLTPTLTSTSTATSTPTPVTGFITGTGGQGVALRDEPAGRIVGFLPERAPVLILYDRINLDNREWLQISDLVGRTGWVLADFIAARP